MKKLFFIFSVLSIILFACSDAKKDKDTSTEGNTTDTTMNKQANMEMPDSATMMKNWQAYMTPGDMQKMMAKSDGTWEADITMWMDPNTPAQKSTGEVVNKMIMNGLYQESTHTGQMMGQAFSGLSITGFDNHLQQFVSTWIDNMGSGIMVMKGPWDEATKTITLTGTMVDPTTKGNVDVKETIQFVDDNSQVFEMFMKTPDGKEVKTMHIDYKRKK
ncbi:MAG: DUF1579 domain-containing protein [Chitinophagaceae bacterium]|nr:DUF1579 domain-containing protein [Chitinophagaceae bacterium]